MNNIRDSQIKKYTPVGNEKQESASLVWCAGCEGLPQD